MRGSIIRIRRLELVSLLEFKRIIQAFLQMGYTPLIMASLCGNTTTVGVLIEAGADLEAVDKVKVWQVSGRRHSS